jgi:hypothetical protein
LKAEFGGGTTPHVPLEGGGRHSLDGACEQLFFNDIYINQKTKSPHINLFIRKKTQHERQKKSLVVTL